nr:reverse transcriptase domain-containing protein [Tanacetum cinerariifolium]
MKDQPLPADASPTALSQGYVVDSNLEKDEKDPKEDLAYYHADRGNNNDDESSNDDDGDDDVEKEEEEKEEEEHLVNKKAYAGSLPQCNQFKSHHSGPCTVKYGNCKKVGHIIQNFRTPATAKNERTRTCYEYGSLRHYNSKCPIVKFHKHVDMIHGMTENKKRLDNTSKNNQNQQQPNKRQNTGRAYTVRHGEKKHYGGSKLLCSKCNYHHNGPCAPKCHKCNRVGHLA